MNNLKCLVEKLWMSITKKCSQMNTRHFLFLFCLSQTGPGVQNGHSCVGNSLNISVSFAYAKGNDHHWLQQLPASAVTALVWEETVFKSSIECIRDTLKPPEMASIVYWEVKINDHGAIQFTCHVFNSKMVIKHLCFSLFVLWFWLHTRSFWLFCLTTRVILYVY